MVAMDQRESLRTMLSERGHPADDAALASFKLDVAATLGPLASALPRRRRAVPAARRARAGHRPG